jgi:hypothetical protein
MSRGIGLLFHPSIPPASQGMMQKRPDRPDYFVFSKKMRHVQRALPLEFFFFFVFAVCLRFAVAFFLAFGAGNFSGGL